MSAYLGPTGLLIPFKCPSALPVAPASRSSLRVTGGGKVKEQRGPRGARVWSADIGTATPDQVAMLGALVDGFYGPPPWRWVDPWAMVTNMLTPAVALMEPGMYVGLGSTSIGGAEVMPDGVITGRTVLNTAGDPLFFADTSDESTWAPVIPGETIMGSAYVVGAGSVDARFYASDGTYLSSVQQPFTAASWQRIGCSAIVPAGAALSIVMVDGATKAALPAITWTTDLAPWSPGKGCGKVTVDGLAEAVQLAVRDEPNMRRSSISFTVQELG